MTRTADVVVIGAGIAGISAAFHLSVRHGVSEVVIADPRPPLSLTSDKSTECYRNFWPSASMVGLTNRSIDIFEDLADQTDFGFNQNGYLFVTGRPETLEGMSRRVDEVAQLGARAGTLDANQIQDRFPFVTDDAVGGLFVPRAGWFRAQDLGQWMLERSREAGVELVAQRVTGIDGTKVELSDGSTIAAGCIVIAAGPLSADVASMAGVDLPLLSELHLKVAFKDHMGVIPRDAPMTIWSDTQSISWSDDERTELKRIGREDVTGEMPIYCHFRPEGGMESPYILALWEYHGKVLEPIWPLPDDPLYPEVVMRGLTTMVPGLSAYADRLPESFVDGGYYTKTVENRPLIGPSGTDGIHLMTGMSGFGIMVSAGAADLLARHIVGSTLPGYSDAFLLSRYEDPDYLASMDTAASGQL